MFRLFRKHETAEQTIAEIVYQIETKYKKLKATK